MPPVPDSRDWHPALSAWLCTGRASWDAVARMPGGIDVAIDSETPSITDSFTIKCVTAAWQGTDSRTVSVLLDPARNRDDRLAAAEVCQRAGSLVMHNAPFDVPGLVNGQMMSLDDIAKVLDVLVYARSAWPDQITGKRLEDVSARLLDMPVLKGGLALAIKAAGFRSVAEWYARGDIDIPFYRFNAMADTVATLRVLEPVQRAAADRQLDHPFGARGATSRAEADELVHKAQRVNRITLRRAARGLTPDLEYLDTYRDSVDMNMIRQSAVLTESGIRPGNGGDLVTTLDGIGALPQGWPRTDKTQKLSAAKEHLALLDHPLAEAHRVVAHGTKILGYLEKTVARSTITGRLHPQINILGASQTGRMSMSEPELHQFPDEARGIIIEDTPGSGISSVDWSSIEPAILAWAANDLDFITPFERGADLYAPIQNACSVERPTAKTVLLAQLYGQGLWALSLKIKAAEAEAKRIKQQMFAAMPGCEIFMRKLKAIAVAHRVVVTLGGRILPIPMVFDEQLGRRKVLDYKAVNFFCQGSNADLVYEALLTAEDEGWADRILLSMHDELIGDTEIAPELERVMRTPPEYFERWTDHVPVIRTDRHDLGKRWAKC